MQPLFIGPYEIGVQQNLKPFMLPEAAFPNLLNAFVFRGRVERKSGYTLLGRLRRVLTAVNAGNITAAGAGTSSFNLFTGLGLLATEPNAQFEPGDITTITIVIGAQTLTDTLGTGTLAIAGAGVITAATLNYATGVLTLTFSGPLAPTAATLTAAYYPGLPVMGIRTRDVPNSANREQTIFFDTKYAYRFQSTFEELPSALVTTWSGADYQQFWTTNYQNDAADNPIFWATNDVSGLHQYAVTTFAAAAAGPPSTVQVTTAVANTFLVGDTVFFNNLFTGGGAVGANNAKFGVVTIAGNPFTISNPATNYFTNEVVTGMALSPNRNVNGDGIRYYSAAAILGAASWSNFNPIINIPAIVNNVNFPGNNVTGALIIVPYKSRLVLLNTQEGNSTATPDRFPQRARWSQNGSALDFVNGWRVDIVGRGGFVDAPTEESIISAGFIKDTLIVYFERSTWQLVYTGNEVLPFIFQRINAELGAESTFSATQFDNGLIAFGNVGVHTSNGMTVARIDEAIPDEIFNMHNNVDGPLRTSGIRDFYQEIVYFAYADSETNTPTSAGKTYFPNKMMIYNYRNNTFSFFNDNATSFGYFQRVNDTTWAELNTFPWQAWNTPWNAGILKAGFPSIAFGNQQGFVSTINPLSSSNNPTLMITNIVPDTNLSNLNGALITSPQHNIFALDSYVTIFNCLGVSNVNTFSFQVLRVDDANTFAIGPSSLGPISGTYLGDGLMTVLSNVIIQTKQFTPFWSKGKRYDLKYIDILFDKTTEGEMQVDLFIDFNDNISMTDIGTGNVLGLPVVSTAPEGANLPYYSFQSQGEQIWKRFYTVANGETFQVQLSFNDTEMRTPAINNSDVVVHAMIFFFEESGEFY